MDTCSDATPTNVRDEGKWTIGLTAANTLAKIGHSVLLLEQHANYGGMATW